ncbi:DNA-3-methyladenine glycosylase family protein [Streptomyces sp. NPDC092952]|uniref:DNA-3-methyladenine glycosylase family protein n=1 Tax=Streptomyces sp. NPDC092952 TaxID=3366018 RepID=UPI003818CB0E
MLTPGGPVRVTVAFAEDQITVALPDETPAPDSLAGLIRRWLDLDSDTERIERELAADPLIGPLVEHRPGIRLIGYPDEFEAVVATVAGQQVSLAAARTFMGRLAADYGTPAAGLRTLPTPQELAAVPDTELQSAVGLTAHGPVRCAPSPSGRVHPRTPHRRPGPQGPARTARHRPLDRGLPHRARTAAPRHLRPRRPGRPQNTRIRHRRPGQDHRREVGAMALLRAHVPADGRCLRSAGEGDGASWAVWGGEGRRASVSRGTRVTP